MADWATRRGKKNAHVALIIRRPGERDGTTILLHWDTELAWICVYFGCYLRLGVRRPDRDRFGSVDKSSLSCRMDFACMAGHGLRSRCLRDTGVFKRVSSTICVRPMNCRFRKSDYECEEFYPLFRVSDLGSTRQRFDLDPGLVRSLPSRVGLL